MDVGIEKVSSDLIPIFFQSFKGNDGTVGTTDVEENSHSKDRRITKESIIKKTYASENLPSPLFAKEG
jgi:hypothetical protein